MAEICSNFDGACAPFFFSSFKKVHLVLHRNLTLQLCEQCCENTCSYIYFNSSTFISKISRSSAIDYFIMVIRFLQALTMRGSVLQRPELFCQVSSWRLVGEAPRLTLVIPHH